MQLGREGRESDQGGPVQGGAQSKGEDPQVETHPGEEGSKPLSAPTRGPTQETRLWPGGGSPG